jgi:hypothetical protein
MAVKLGGSGGISADRLWHLPSDTQRVGTGMIGGDLVPHFSPPDCRVLWRTVGHPPLSRLRYASLCKAPSNKAIALFHQRIQVTCWRIPRLTAVI